MSRFPYSHTLPFFLYLIFLGIEQGLGSLQSAGHAWIAGWDLRWVYPIKVALIGALLWRFRRSYLELQSFGAVAGQHWLYALLAGVAVFVLWINLDFGWAMLSSNSNGFNPTMVDGAIDWRLALPRLLGAALVVPLMEELFWRSFFMRWLDHQDFQVLKPAQVSLRAFLATSVIFGFEHQMWFAGIIAGLVYGWLYMRSGKLWVAVVAHGVTNGLLGIWVLQTGNWQFW